MFHRFRKSTLYVIILSAALFSLLQPALINAQEDYDLDAITQGVGRYHVLTESGAETRVFLIQENHSLVSGQVESAVMIHRLVRDYGLRLVGVEGAFPDSSFDTGWFSKPLPANMVRNLAVQLLGEGEINQGELAALVYPHFVEFTIEDSFAVFGIDNEEVFGRARPDSYTDLQTAMLFTAIAQLALLDETQFEAVVEHLGIMPGDDASDEEFFDWRDVLLALTYDNHPDKQVQSWYQAEFGEPETCMAIGIGETIENMDLGFQIVANNRATTEELWGPDIGLDSLLENAHMEYDFNVNAHERDMLMVNEIERWLNDHPGESLAAIIGAAHTGWMEERLEADGFGTIVLSPESLCDESLAVSLNAAEYNSRDQGLSVDTGGGIGQILGSIVVPVTPIKPPVVLNQPWFQVKSAAMGIAALATEGFRDNPDATLDDIFKDKEFIPGVEIDTTSLERVVDEPPRYVFTININVKDIGVNQLHIGILTDIDRGNEADLDLETLLLKELDRLRETKQREQTDPVTNLTQVAPNVGAVFGGDKASTKEAVRSISTI